jgi:hypothetical protein
MLRRSIVSAVLTVGLACAICTGIFAQEGHPLTGTWHGAWVSPTGQRSPVVLFLEWDTKNIVGKVNPGPNGMDVKVAQLDPANWTIHFQAEGKDKAGAAVRVAIDAKLDNIGSYNRTLKGTWTQGSVKGNFEASRD